MYRANVSWTVMQDFLKELEAEKLVDTVSQRSGHKKYVLSEKGMECLRTMLAAKSLLGEGEGEGEGEEESYR
jgi:predicted transcriptional regulator